MMRTELASVRWRRPIAKVSSLSINRFPATFTRYVWKSICKAAEILGKKEKLPVYKFLKEPLVRRFGKDWYEALEEIAGEWEKQKNEE